MKPPSYGIEEIENQKKCELENSKVLGICSYKIENLMDSRTSCHILVSSNQKIVIWGTVNEVYKMEIRLYLEFDHIFEGYPV